MATERAGKASEPKTPRHPLPMSPTQASVNVALSKPNWQEQLKHTVSVLLAHPAVPHLKIAPPHFFGGLMVSIIGNMFHIGFAILLLAYWYAKSIGHTWLFFATLAFYEILPWYLYPNFPKTGGLRWHGFSSGWWWRAVGYYFNMRMVAKESLKFEPNKQYMFCCHPHGVHGFGLGVFNYEGEDNELYRRFPFLKGKVTCFCASVLFYMPFVRELLGFSGFRDASREIIRKSIRDGDHPALLIGGEAESLVATPGSDIAVAAGPKRKGFVRLALQEKVELVPVYFFGNVDLYHVFHWGWAFRKWLSKAYQICIPIFIGRWFTFTPFNIDMPVAVGSPLPLPESIPLKPDGTPEDSVIDLYHEQYLEALGQLFEDFKHEAGYPPDRKLVITES